MMKKLRDFFNVLLRSEEIFANKSLLTYILLYFPLIAFGVLFSIQTVLLTNIYANNERLIRTLLEKVNKASGVQEPLVIPYSFIATDLVKYLEIFIILLSILLFCFIVLVLVIFIYRKTQTPKN